MTYYETLIEKYEKLLEAKPDSIGAVINLARLYLKTQDIDKSITFYEALIDPMPKNPEVFKSMGVLYLAKDDKREAIKYLKKALKLDIREPLLYEYAAEIDTEKADECYEIALDLRSSNKMTDVKAMHCFLVAMKLYKSEKYQIAIRYLWVIKELMGDTVEYKNLLGSIYYKTGKYDEAIEAYSIAYELLGYLHHNIAINIAACYAKKGEFELSLKCLTAALEVSDNPKRLYYHLALIYLSMDDKINSLYNLKQALDIDDEYEMAKNLYYDVTDQLEEEVSSISTVASLSMDD